MANYHYCITSHLVSTFEVYTSLSSAYVHVAELNKRSSYRDQVKGEEEPHNWESAEPERAQFFSKAYVAVKMARPTSARDHPGQKPHATRPRTVQPCRTPTHGLATAPHLSAAGRARLVSLPSVAYAHPGFRTPTCPRTPPAAGPDGRQPAPRGHASRHSGGRRSFDSVRRTA